MGLSYGPFLFPESLFLFGTSRAGSVTRSGVLASACGDANLCPSAGCAILEKSLCLPEDLSLLVWEGCCFLLPGVVGGFCELQDTVCLEDHVASGGCPLTLLSCYKSLISLSLLLAFLKKLNWKEPNNARLSFSSLGEKRHLSLQLRRSPHPLQKSREMSQPAASCSNSFITTWLQHPLSPGPKIERKQKFLSHFQILNLTPLFLSQFLAKPTKWVTKKGKQV